MKAVALIQFYFDYVLPRGGDWEGRSLRFSQDEGWHVIVRPRRINEALFPNEIDQTLSTMHFVLARLNTPTGQTAVRVIERCHDRVEVQVWRDVSGVQTVQRPEMQEEFLRSAIQACNTFLNHCRVVAQAPFVHGVEQQYRLQDGRYHILMPYTITWLDGTNNERLPVYPENVNASASPGAVPAPERGFVDFAKIIDALKVGPEPNLPRSFLLDAEEMLRTVRIREAVVSMAVACEIAVNELLSRHGKSEDPEVKRIFRKRSLSFAERCLSCLCQAAVGKSLKSEQPEAFEKVENLYQARNNTVHEGRCYYNDGEYKVQVCEKQAVEFLEATTSTINWLESL